MKSPEKIVLLETVKLNTHEICKLLQLKQSVKFSPCKKGFQRCFSKLFFKDVFQRCFSKMFLKDTVFFKDQILK